MNHFQKNAWALRTVNHNRSVWKLPLYRLFNQTTELLETVQKPGISVSIFYLLPPVWPYYNLPLPLWAHCVRNLDQQSLSFWDVGFHWMAANLQGTTVLLTGVHQLSLLPLTVLAKASTCSLTLIVITHLALRDPAFISAYVGYKIGCEVLKRQRVSRRS